MKPWFKRQLGFVSSPMKHSNQQVCINSEQNLEKFNTDLSGTNNF